MLPTPHAGRNVIAGTRLDPAAVMQPMSCVLQESAKKIWEETWNQKLTTDF